MKISHEVPLQLLGASRWFNDYDYALVHLFDQYPEYLNFYRRSIEIGRTVILDNSLYELGEAFNMDDYASWIEKLQPTYYIIPDTFWDADRTIEQAIEWMYKYGKNLPGKLMGVAQGNTYNDIARCYKFMSAFCDRIAFTFKFSPNVINDIDFHDYVADHFSCDCPTDIQAACRYWVLERLHASNIIDVTKEHHLLGIQNTTALSNIAQWDWITSIDTSNPIINGFLHNRYDSNGNTHCDKPTKTLRDFFTDDCCDPQTLEDIRHNVRIFRDLTIKQNL